MRECTLIWPKSGDAEPPLTCGDGVIKVNPLRDFMNSLAAMRRLPDARLLPAHGPVIDSVHARSTNWSRTTGPGSMRQRPRFTGERLRLMTRLRP